MCSSDLHLARGQVVWFEFDGRMPWLHVLLGAVTVLGLLVALTVVPVWRYRVHRWEIGPQAVYTRTGWLVQERRIAPISRVQTIDTYRGPLDRCSGWPTSRSPRPPRRVRCTSSRLIPTSLTTSSPN